MAHDDRERDAARHADYRRRDRLLPWPKVRDLYGISRTTAWRLQKVGEFPCPVQISAGRVGWRESDLIAWAASRATRALTPSTGARPEPSPPTSHPRPPSQERPAPVETTGSSPSPPRRRRTRPGAEGQIAFEF